MEVGIDIVELEHIKDEKLLASKILSESEFLLYQKKENKLQFLGGRFAAKEALIKALGLSILGINLKDIEILNKENGKPYLIYKNKEYKVSISHEKHCAIAIVIDEK